MDTSYLPGFKKVHDAIEKLINSPAEGTPFHLNGDFDWYGNNPIVGDINDMIDSIIEMDRSRNG